MIIADKSTSCLKIGTPAEKYKGVFFPKVARNDEEKSASQNPEIETSKAEEESLHKNNDDKSCSFCAFCNESGKFAAAPCTVV